MNSPFRASTVPEKARLRVEDFLLLNDSGAFDRYSKTELIEGEIYFMNAQHSRHARVKTEIAVELAIQLRAMGGTLAPIVEASTRVGDYSLPEPDVVVTDYKGPDIVPLESVALIVEVADSTIRVDMGRKQRIYAQAGIAEYWVFDLKRKRVIQMWSPKGDTYAERAEIPLGQRIASVTVADLAIELRDFG